VHDSVYGNTAAIAAAIGEALGGQNPVTVLPVAEAGGIDIDTIDLLLVGSPTRGFRPTPAIDEFVAGLPAPKGGGVTAAAFDTRIDLETVHPVPLRWVVGAGGYAADRLAAALTRKGFPLAGASGGFVVTGTEGPLKAGEVERARDWAAGLVSVPEPA